MKILASILLTISLIIIVNEVITQKYLNYIKVSFDIENHFQKTKFVFLEKKSEGSNNACSDCVYNYKGLILNSKDTLKIRGIDSKLSKLLKYDEKDEYLYFDVWYCNHTKIANLIKDDDPLKYKPSLTYSEFLKAWTVYLFCIISIIFSIVAFKRK